MGNTDFKTPHFDRLARAGVRFSDCYANAPVCSPSRASILTGRYPRKAGVPGNVDIHLIKKDDPAAVHGIFEDVPTAAEIFKDAGYRTGMAGKWHLGYEPGFRPEDKGFQHWQGFLQGCVDYYSHLFYYEFPHGVNPLHDLWRDGDRVYENGRYATEMISDYAVDFIRDSCVADSPFFLYVSYNAPHYPLHAPPKYLDRFKHLPEDRRIMAAMLSAADDGVGEILNELERQGVLEDTMIAFQSDNGPSRESRNWLDGREDVYYGSTAGVFKGHKKSLFEGGIRMPAIMSWPGTIPEGGVSDSPVTGMDILPTMLEAAGQSAEGYNFDGKSLLSMLKEKGPSPHEALFWEIGPQKAMRKGPWKLVTDGYLVDGIEEEDKIFLSRLDEDPSESVNLRRKKPEVLEEMLTSLEAWYEEVKSSLPIENSL